MLMVGTIIKVPNQVKPITQKVSLINHSRMCAFSYLRIVCISSSCAIVGHPKVVLKMELHPWRDKKNACRKIYKRLLYAV